MTTKRRLLTQMHPAERAFAASLERAGKLWFYEPRLFRLPPPHRSYTPDFYVVDDGRFYEVAGTRQAYSYQREKIAAFRAHYPQYRLEVVNQGAWRTDRPHRPRVARVKPASHRPRVARVKPAFSSTRSRNGSYALEHLALRREQLPARGQAIVATMERLGIPTLADLAVRAGMSYGALRWYVIRPRVTPAAHRRFEAFLATTSSKSEATA